MLRETDKEYFARRAREERSAAREASDARSREAHRQLAASYEMLASEGYFPKDDHLYAGEVSAGNSERFHETLAGSTRS